MHVLLLLGTIIVPLVMFALRRRRVVALFDLLAALSVLLANMSAGMSVLEIKLAHSEYTTHVHQVFMDPLFLITGAYIGVYAVYRLLAASADSWQKRLS